MTSKWAEQQPGPVWGCREGWDAEAGGGQVKGPPGLLDTSPCRQEGGCPEASGWGSVPGPQGQG